ncbi:MAG: Crp/Fnr family transcriptional regulator [Brucellaceae bacterium]|nr:Crp/Fnr family transcriptional regulator [Brucellaceae bacterium]
MAAALQHEDAEVLSKSPMLRAIGPDLRQRFLDTVTIEEFEKRHPLFREGDPARAFYFVIRGWVQLSRIDATGKEAAVGLFGPGESFGEAAMFLGNKYPVDAHVVEAARLARVDSDRMMKLLETNSGLCFAMLGSMSLHLHKLVARLSGDRLQKADLRLAAYLVDLSPAGSQSACIKLPIDKGVLASTLGMAPEALSRSFATLKQAGVVVEGRNIHLYNVDALRAFASGGD